MTTHLLDTHVMLWFRAKPEALGIESLALLKNPETEFAVSVVSALELAQLVYKNRITLPLPPDQWFEESAAYFQARTVSITVQITAEAYRLPEDFHADPADRILAATARLDKMNLLTADERILRCQSIPTFDARS